MSARVYTEDQLVEQPAITLFADLGWQTVSAREDEPRRLSLEVMLRGTCAPARLLDIAENFTLFSEHKSGW